MVKRLLIQWLVLVFMCVSAKAQVFQKTYGGNQIDAAVYGQPTADGGYIMAGYTYSFGQGGSEVYLVKTDSVGGIVWTKTYGGTGLEEAAWVQQTRDGGYIIAGNTSSFGKGSQDVYVIKTNATGDTLWTRTFGNVNSDYGFSIYQTSDNGYAITGYTLSYGGGLFTDVLILRTDSLGNQDWCKTFGGAQDDKGNVILQTNDSAYIIAGVTASFGAGGTDIYLIKTNVYGDTAWTKAIGGTGNDIAYDIKQTADHGYIITGVTAEGTGGTDAFLLKTDSNGTVTWVKTYGGQYEDRGRSVYIAADGYIMAGSSSSFAPQGTYEDVYLVKTNWTGDTVWSRTYGGDNAVERASSVQAIPGGYAVTGYTANNACLIKTYNNGHSGCNEKTVSSVFDTPVFQATRGGGVVFPVVIPTGGTNTKTGSGGTATTICLGTDISEEPTENLLHIYPNPSNGYLKIDAGGKIENGTVRIYNLQGQMVFEEDIAATFIKELKPEHISPGIYFVRISANQGEYTAKWVVE